MDLIIKNKEKFHHLKGKTKTKAVAKPKAETKPAKKEPAYLPADVMKNIKGFLNVGKDAKKSKEVVYEYTIGGDGLPEPKKPTTFYIRWGGDVKWYNPVYFAERLANAYLRILTDRELTVGTGDAPWTGTEEFNKRMKVIEEKIKNSPVYAVKTILPVLRRKNAKETLLHSWHGDKSLQDKKRRFYSYKGKLDLKEDILKTLGTKRRSTVKGMRFIKI